MPPLTSARAPSVPPEKLIATLRDLALEATERGQAAAARELGLMADRMQAELDATRPDSPTA